ncbi:MAG: peptidyl-prolyl cis-trans isomerase [Oscillospiraceae bacterium]|nr:peptidyl-prolyl cis-trans isomerase [Oscillospiraceae bacterium]
MKRKLTAFLLSLVLVLSLAACAAPTPAPAQPDAEDAAGADDMAESILLVGDDQVIATLGEYTLLATTYAYFFAVSRTNMENSAMMSGYGPGDMAAFWAMEQGGVSIRDMMLEETMSLAKEYTELYRTAVALGAAESEEAAEMAAAQVEGLLAGLGNNEDAFIRNYNLTPDQMRGVMRRLGVAVEYLQSAMESIEVTEADMLEAYLDDPDAFDQVTVRHILINANDGMSAEEQEAAGTLAQELLARIDAGEDIGTLAGEYSEDPGSRDNNGEYTFGQGVMVPEFEAFAFGAQPGDTGVVCTNFGYHVMELIGRTGFDQVSPAQLEQQARLNLFYQNHADLYGRVESPDWVYDRELLARFAAQLA